ncbi:MAG: hypothetical protein HOJ16_07100 [Candidatus Peribacter sp.]|jgi:hypothetical protein|nr:hypothetical protein [Candidatus Peribacter sp.]MBT4393063.1 hypothetical protein [Candidatus Peribacter sp.]MBT4600861.1 hypothetical protein [Candidatus Peribacter sp.]MBT5149008.1 hypothetical protein [Candidatus Peribacter sp.]MBT5638312.1 hypothetical protein [Candidatus Peribacter sp.]
MRIKTYQRSGVLFLDALIGVAVFSIVVSGVIYAMLFSQQGMLKSGDRIRAVFLNQKAIAAVRAVRDSDFSNLTEGTFGARLNPSGAWELSGTGVTTEDGYTTFVTITSLSSERMSATALSVWDFGIGASGSTVLSTEITDWHRVQEVGNWALASLDGAYIDDDTPLFNSAAATLTHAFATSETSDGGAGLYVFDITDTSDPLRIAEGFNLGAAGHDILIVGTNLFIITEDSGQEVRIYDIETPSSFNTGNFVASINVPGNAKARAFAYYDDTLYVTAAEDTGESEIYSYDVSDLGSISQLDDLNDPGSSFLDIRLLNGYAYLGSSMDTMELRVVDVFDPSDLEFAAGGGYNLTDTTDATSIAALGDYILVGRNQGDITEELHLFDVSESPVPPDAPWNAETGESVNALDADPTATYAFAATNHDSQELVVLNIATFAAGGNPITETYNTTTGDGRGVTYDILHDRVFLLTNTAFIILQPS